MKQSGFGIASLIIGILSLVFSCIGAGFLGILGIVFSIVAFTKKDRGKGLAIAGLITSIIAALLSFIFLIVVLPSNSDDSKEKSKIERADDQGENDSSATIYKDSDYTYEVKKYDIKKINGVSCILIYSEFTNNSSESVSASNNMLLNVFQDGVELEDVYEEDYSEETANYWKKVKPGKKIEVCEIFQLSNKESDVEIEISNAFLIGGDTAKGTIKIK